MGTGGDGAAQAGGMSGDGGDGGAGGSPPPPPELVAWYRFEDSAGAVIDSSMYANHGLASATVQRGVAGKIGDGVRFDGNLSNIDIPVSSSLDITTNITIEAWIYLDAPAGYNRMLVRKALQYQMSISVIPQPNLLEFYSQPLMFARTTQPVEFAHWDHVAVTHDGLTARLYIDGELRNEVPHAGTFPSNSSPLKLGGDGFNQNAPDGGMDEVKIWNVVRSEQEICQDGGGTYDANAMPRCTI